MKRQKEQKIDWNDYTFYEDKRIWSKHYNRFLEGYVTKYGYVNVGLKCIDGKYRLFQWHRVIYTYFKGEIPEGMQVNHIDENKQNNALSNLNLMTPKENCNWGTGIQRGAAKRRGIPRPDVSEKFKGVPKTEEHKAKLKNNPLKSKPVVAVDDEGNVVMEFASMSEAERNGFYSSNVCKCCNNCFHRQGNNIYKGLRWFYKSEWEKLVWERKLEVKKV